MWPFKKRIKPLNNTILLRWRHEAFDNLTFIGTWSGYWKTRINGINYRSETVSGFKAVVGDTGTFIQDALIDRATLAKYPSKNSEELGMCRDRFVDADGNVERWIL